MANIVDQITIGEKTIVVVDADPRSAGGTIAPVGSIALFDNAGTAEYYLKKTDTATNWESIVDSDLLKQQSPDKAIYVDKKGDDTTGDGSLLFPFLTVGQAITHVNTLSPSTTNRYEIHIGIGTFQENPIIVPDYVNVKGCGFNITVIEALDQNSDLITTGNANEISGITFTGLNNASFYTVRVNITGFEVSFLSGCGVTNGTNGLIISSTVPGAGFVVKDCGFTSLTGEMITVHTNVDTTIEECRFIGTNTAETGIKIQSNGIATIKGGTFQLCHTGIDNSSTGKVIVTDTDLTSTTIPFIKTSTSELIVSGIIGDASDALVLDSSNVRGHIIDEVQGDSTFRIFDILSVGTPENGRETSIGQGTPYTNGMLVYNSDGVTFTDISSAAASKDPSLFSFPSVNTNSAIYVTTRRVSDVDNLKFFGIQHTCVTASVDGEIVCEFWNGSSWIEFNHMSTETNASHLPYAKQIFERTGIENVRFQNTIADQWVKNDPMTLGTDYYWMRFRIVSPLTTAPIFQQFKLHTNSAGIESDGYIEYFGTGRVTSLLSFDSSTFQAALKSPTDANVLFSDSLDIGRIENYFLGGTVDRSGFVTPVPSDMDTSCPITATIFMTSPQAGAESTTWNIRWSNSKNGDLVATSAVDAPTTAVREQLVTQEVLKPVNADEQFSATFSLDVSDIITRDANTISDLFWCTIERAGAGESSDIAIIQVEFKYTKYSNGGHTK